MSDRLALLERAQQGDDRAPAQLLTENAGLIWSIVRRYNGCGVETDDLYQLGCIGFVKAVKGFDLTYGTQFSTYAVPKIAGEIRRFLRDDGPVKWAAPCGKRGRHFGRHGNGCKGVWAVSQSCHSWQRRPA